MTHPDGGLGEVTQVGVHGLSSGDAQKGASQRGPANEAIADEVEEQVMGRQCLENGCEGNAHHQLSLLYCPTTFLVPFTFEI